MPEIALDYILTNGQPADADQVMANFNEIVAAANDLDVNNLAASLRELLVPTGSLLAFGGASAPAGFLLCDGAAVSRATYAALFTAISTAYGVGDGSTTFNLPDLRGRVPVGVDGAAARLASNDALGNSGGVESVVLTAAQAKHGTTPIGASGGNNVLYETGGASHTNLQPYQVVNHIIKI